MDRHKFLKRKEKNDECLEQFWHALSGLAANCDFGTQTTGIVYDIFVSNMNKTRTPQVGAISKAQKVQNIFLEKNLKISKKNSFGKCRTVPKNVKGGTLFDL